MPFNNPIPDDKRPQGQPPQQPKRDTGGLATLVEAEKMMQIAILLPSSAFIGWLIGGWLDKALKQSWIGLTGIILGGFAGLFYVVRLVIDASKPKPGSKPGAGSGSSENKS